RSSPARASALRSATTSRRPKARSSSPRRWGSAPRPRPTTAAGVSRTRAAAQVAHEIKNPLGSIRLGVAMLRDMTKDREAINTINLVERGIEHLSKLTLDVTQFSRRRQLTLTPDVYLAELLNESLDLITEKLREKRTPVERRFPEEPVRGHWDEDQLRQVFVNLLANAVDAGPAESPLTLSAERVNIPAGDRRNGEGGRQVPAARVSIIDRGQGMDERTRARIFEP